MPGVATFRTARVSLWRVGWQKQRLASHAAVKSPWLSPSSARILRWVNKVPTACVSLSLPSAIAHMTEAAAADYTFKLWCYGSPSPPTPLSSLLSPQRQPVPDARQSADFIRWVSDPRSCRFLFFSPHRSEFPRFPGVRFPPFFPPPWTYTLSISLLSNCRRSLSSQRVLPPTV